MPHFWNNILVVTKDELVPDWYKSWISLKLSLHRHKDKTYGIKRARLGGFGHELLVNFDTLPHHIQDGIGDPRKINHILERFYKIDGEAVTWFATYQFDDGGYLDMKYQERYIINASVLKAVIHLRAARLTEWRTKGRLTKKGLISLLCSDAASFNTVLKSKHNAEHTMPPGEKAFKELLKAFETTGYVALISGKHKNQNTRKVTGDTLVLLNNMFAGDRAKPTATEVHRRYAQFLSGTLEIINNNTGEIYDPADFKELSNGTVKKYMAAWVNRIGTHAKRSGNRQKLMQQYKPYHSLGQGDYAGSLISIDDRQPPFKALDGKRIWFYLGRDLFSGAFTCWVYGKTKEGIILDFYRQLVRNYAEWGLHLPAELEAEMSLNSSFTDTFLKEGVMFQHVRIEANNARGKIIERDNRTLRYEYEKNREGWLARPHALSESNQAGIEIEKVPMIPYEKIVEGCLIDIETHNNKPHKIHTDKTRWDVFCEMQHPDLKPTNYAAILPHIGRKTETSCNTGIIRLKGREYLLGDKGMISLGDRLIRFMKLIEGRDIDVYWLDDNNGRVFKAVVYIGTQYICEALPKPVYNRAKIEQGPADQAAREIMSAYVATIEGFGRKQKRSIEPVTTIDNRPKLKKSFIMPGIKQYDRSENTPAEVLPEIVENDYSDFAERSFVRSLKDRF